MVGVAHGLAELREVGERLGEGEELAGQLRAEDVRYDYYLQTRYFSTFEGNSNPASSPPSSMPLFFFFTFETCIRRVVM